MMEKLARDVPCVSIVIPIFNTEQYLEQCMESVVAQTLRDIEIICINDGSTDGSLAILERFAQQDARIIIIDKPNSGYGDSMNIGMQRATGLYVGIVEPDDYVAVEMFAELYAKASELDLDVVKSDFFRVIGSGADVCMQYQQLEKDCSFYDRVLCPREELAAFSFVMSTWVGIYRRSFLLQHNIRYYPSPGASYQDTSFWYQTLMFAQRLYLLKQAFYFYRTDNENSSMKQRGKVFCICDEFANIRSIIDASEDLQRDFLGVFHYNKFKTYMANYNRVADEFKLEFLAEFSRQMRQAAEAGELDFSLFDRRRAKRARALMRDYVRFHQSRTRKNRLLRRLGIYRERSRGKKVTYLFGIKIFVS